MSNYIMEKCDEQEFIEVNEKKYIYPNDKLYSCNIGKNLSDERLIELYEWKNGMKLASLKRVSVVKNYQKGYGEELEKRYLNSKKPGGPIWNIFYLHINDPEKWPIFDQHVYRAMCHIKNAEIQELTENKSEIYEIYQSEYIPFFKRFREKSYRRKDKALFAYGKSLKKLKKCK